MKRIILAVIAVSLSTGLFAQNIQLPAPVKTGGMTLREALSKRQSNRESAPDKQLSNQQLSDLLWCAWGYNRPDKRTAPSWKNWQEIDVYVVMAKGAFRYDAKNNVLVQVSKDDLRKKCGGQEFVSKAALNLVYVCDKARTDEKEEQTLLQATYANTGLIAQNAYLYCASEGLNCVVRGSVPKDELSKALNLRAEQMITLAQTIGVPN